MEVPYSKPLRGELLQEITLLSGSFPLHTKSLLAEVHKRSLIHDDVVDIGWVLPTRQAAC